MHNLARNTVVSIYCIEICFDRNCSARIILRVNNSRQFISWFFFVVKTIFINIPGVPWKAGIVRGFNALHLAQLYRSYRGFFIFFFFLLARISLSASISVRVGYLTFTSDTHKNRRLSFRMRLMDSKITVAIFTRIFFFCKMFRVVRKRFIAVEIPQFGF